MQNNRARLKRVERKTGKEQEIKSFEVVITPLREFDREKAVLISTSRKGSEPNYTEYYRIETGETVKREVSGIVSIYSLDKPEETETGGLTPCKA